MDIFQLILTTDYPVFIKYVLLTSSSVLALIVLVCSIIHFTIGNIFVSMNYFRYVDDSNNDKKIRSMKKWIYLRFLVALLIPFSFFCAGIVLSSQFMIVAGIISLIFDFVGYMLGKNSRIEKIKEIGLTLSKGSLVSIVINYPVGTWESGIIVFLGRNYWLQLRLFGFSVILFVLAVLAMIFLPGYPWLDIRLVF